MDVREQFVDIVSRNKEIVIETCGIDNILPFNGEQNCLKIARRASRASVVTIFGLPKTSSETLPALRPLQYNPAARLLRNRKPAVGFGQSVERG